MYGQIDVILMRCAWMSSFQEYLHRDFRRQSLLLRLCRQEKEDVVLVLEPSRHRLVSDVLLEFAFLAYKAADEYQRRSEAKRTASEWISGGNTNSILPHTNPDNPALQTPMEDFK